MPEQNNLRIGSPEERDDGPRLLQVGLIAGVCFVIGILWPTLAGIRLVPEVPGKSKPSAPGAQPQPERRTPTHGPTKAVPVSKAVAMDPDRTQTVTARVTKTLVVNCKDDDDRALQSCDTPGFDSVAEARLLSLASCSGLGQVNGTLSIGFDLDFKAKKITRILHGKSTTLGKQDTETLIGCAKQEFLTASLDDVEHTHPRYLVFFMVEFSPPGSLKEVEPQDSIVAASGKATIVWNSARVREEPETGKVASRLLYGARVVVTGRKGEWYRVRYDAAGNEGWVHKNALNL